MTPPPGAGAEGYMPPPRGVSYHWSPNCCEALRGEVIEEGGGEGSPTLKRKPGGVPLNQRQRHTAIGSLSPAASLWKCASTRASGSQGRTPLGGEGHTFPHHEETHSTKGAGKDWHLNSLKQNRVAKRHNQPSNFRYNCDTGRFVQECKNKKISASKLSS